MYKVSVLIPIYGVEQYIERCSRSLLEQSYQNLEFVFVNDCTPDRSIEVLHKVMNDYPERKEVVRIVNHEKNLGLAASRNTCLDQSQGEFVICIDSDDWIELNAIELLVNKQLEKDADIVSGDRLVHYENEERFFKEKDYQNKEQMTLNMMQRTWDHLLAGRLIRRSLFIDNKLRWNDGLDTAEDRYIMTLLAYNAAGFDKVDGVVYHYERRNNNALTKTDDGRKILRNNRQELNNLMLLEDYFKDKALKYQNECSLCLIRQLDYNYQSALKYSDKDEFDSVVDYIDSRSEAEKELINWKVKGLKGWIKHRFVCMRCVRFIKQIIRKY